MNEGDLFRIMSEAEVVERFGEKILKLDSAWRDGINKSQFNAICRCVEHVLPSVLIFYYDIHCKRTSVIHSRYCVTINISDCIRELLYE